MNANRIYPVAGQTYSLPEIGKLYLTDQPFLRIMHEGRLEVIQFSGDWEELCENALFAESRWTYVRTTDEAIPLFTFASDNDWPLEVLVTIEPSEWFDVHGRRDKDHWVCFIGHHEPQLTEEQKKMMNLRRESPRPLPVAKVEEPVVEPSPHFSFKEVIESIIQIPSFSIEEMLADPEKAKVYVEFRSENAKEFRASLVWDCSAEDDLDKAKLYFTGMVYRYKPNHTLRSVYWGMVNLFDVAGQKRAPVYFKTEDCFVAWVLATFW